jgi:hypothetical protein
MRTLSLLALGVLICGCKKADPTFAPTEASLNALLAEKGSEAYVSEEMIQIEEQLARVERGSSSLKPAQALLEQIYSERKKIETASPEKKRQSRQLSKWPLKGTPVRAIIDAGRCFYAGPVFKGDNTYMLDITQRECREEWTGWVSRSAVIRGGEIADVVDTDELP